ncbi:25S rRNA (Uridine-N(3))-methyltransferase [Mycena venus]|uniref:25S rRNA (Uridine-N(3))-methyltransferase n=1 Tax=Mycena venus TaxID=2733690 RepID=A0A8H6XUN4_9AGAR|nr:25S rRNA (Uridine-N(3))-methyltransferase [Mycena venus]
MAKSKKPLKAALQSQQSRLKIKQKAAQAAQTAELMSKKHAGGGKGKSSHTASAATKGKGKEVAPPRRPTIPFRPTDNILLLGEGNFSFARALIRDAPAELEHLPPKNVTATAYDTEEECYEKYPEAAEIVRDLRAAGVEVFFGIDATQLGKVAVFKGKKWDRVVWNFPHAGKGITDQDRNILSNQLLILGFLRSAAGFLVNGPVPEIFSPRKRKRPDDEDEAEEDEDMGDNTNVDDDDIVKPVACRGTILITLRNVVPYTQWDVPRLAKNPPPPTTGSTPPNPQYIILRSFFFNRSTWKGYEHRMTKGERAHGTGKTGEGGEDRTWEFCLKD